MLTNPYGGGYNKIYECAALFILSKITQKESFMCKAKEWSVAVAILIDDNAADEDSGKLFCKT